mmetsp:Transcript_11175/g.38057  ORF Transcript_11175/g.38057 Transcript_11175/m.38057 type:complete len:259 (+) Transcript_11175:440-1216(+)
MSFRSSTGPWARAEAEAMERTLSRPLRVPAAACTAQSETRDQPRVRRKARRGGGGGAGPSGSGGAPSAGALVSDRSDWERRMCLERGGLLGVGLEAEDRILRREMMPWAPHPGRNWSCSVAQWERGPAPGESPDGERQSRGARDAKGHQEAVRPWARATHAGAGEGGEGPRRGDVGSGRSLYAAHTRAANRLARARTPGIWPTTPSTVASEKSHESRSAEEKPEQRAAGLQGLPPKPFHACTRYSSTPPADAGSAESM